MKTLFSLTSAVPLLCAGALAQAPGAHWSATTSGGLTDPPVRLENPGAADYSNMYVFGGRDTAGVRRNDLWSFDGTTWTMKTADGAAGAPPARDTAGVAWNFNRNRLTVFGGWDGSNYLGDTWEWNPVNNTWANVTPGGTGPSPRRYCAIAYDPASGKMLLFGGKDSSGSLNDTWMFDGSGWTQLSPSGTLPGTRQLHHLVTRIDFADVVLFGGFDTGASSIRQDTWRWDNGTTSWIQIVTPTLPTHTFANDTAYDMLRKRIVMTGGNNSGGNPGGVTWEFDCVTNDWVSRPLDSGIYKCTRYFAAYVLSLGKTFKCGGQALNASAPPDKTYEFQTDVPATFTSGSPGCATSAGVPMLQAADQAWGGRNLVMEVTSTPGGSVSAIAIGATTLSTPIPLSVIGIGNPSCVVTVDPVGVYPAPVSGVTNRPTLTIPVPSDPALVGGVVTNQALVVDFGANLTYVSNRGDAVIGAL